MKTNPPNALSCEQALARLDLLLDGELDDAELLAMEAHVAECGRCRAEAERRDQLRAKLRQALRKPAAAPEFEQRVQTMIRMEARRGFRFQWQYAAAAAAVVIGLSGTVAYQLGHLRLSYQQQEAYVTSISEKVSNIMRVGLIDHVHCAVFKKWPKQSPPLDEIVKEMEPKYRPVATLVKQNIPASYRVLTAHQCTARGRKYIHMAMMSTEGNLVSLVMSEKRTGETFANNGIRQESAQRFRMAGFETAGFLAYVISDMDEKQNQQLAEAIAGPVKTFFNSLG
ncbi:MAG: zf-HC2 domain-containing protein [Acidobacteria bacterium]|nr:zf-HC2 domain-containing protein [Acidobacteriota bacterium]